MLFLHLERFTISMNDFDFDINDLLFFLKDVDMRNFADDTTEYICDENLQNVLKSLETCLLFVGSTTVT